MKQKPINRFDFPKLLDNIEPYELDVNSTFTASNEFREEINFVIEGKKHSFDGIVRVDGTFRHKIYNNRYLTHDGSVIGYTVTIMNYNITDNKGTDFYLSPTFKRRLESSIHKALKINII